MYPGQSGIKYYNFSHQNSEGFSVGDTVNIKLLKNSQPVLNQGRLLYAVVQNSLGDYKTTEGTSFSYTFSKADIPNIAIWGAYFDGKNVFPVSSDFLTYDPGEMQLTVATVPNRDGFTPGSEVHLDICVTDKNQKPVKGAAVSSLVPYIKYYLPDVKVVAVLLTRRVTLEQSKDISLLLGSIAKSKKCLVVGSVDFSHGLPAKEAKIRDEVTSKAILNNNLERIKRMTNGNLDLPETLCSILYYMQERGACAATLFSHKSAAEFLENPVLQDCTTYFVLGSP
ncbi:MAG: AmmeMemoRadiSam system protein B [Fermentimonas sp.]|nr:AmmeMemoRadiSam system protein B [Fermentimonas sp.]